MKWMFHVSRFIDDFSSDFNGIYVQFSEFKIEITEVKEERRLA